MHQVDSKLDLGRANWPLGIPGRFTVAFVVVMGEHPSGKDRTGTKHPKITVPPWEQAVARTGLPSPQIGDVLHWV
jgi:hypothetical protein